MCKAKYKKITIQDLLDFGIPRACFCRTDPKLEIEPKYKHLFISKGIKNAYNEEIVILFIDFFGRDEVLRAINLTRESSSKKFYNNITNIINKYTYGKHC